jgi:zinc transporter, ZIP family
MQQTQQTIPQPSDSTETPSTKNNNLGKTALQLLVPIALLAGVILLFIRTNGAGLNAQPAAPIEALQFDRTILKPDQIELQVTNTSPQDMTISQIIVNDSFWMFQVKPNPVIPRLGKATITLAYPWVQGEMYTLRLLTANAVPFNHVIDVASETKAANSSTLLSFTLIGLYVGLIPVLLGMLWLPVLRGLSQQWVTFFTAVTVGLLIFLGIDAANEALEQAAQLGGAFQGVGIIGIGIVGTFMLLHALSRRQERLSSGSGSSQRLSLAFMVALSIGLHNFGEGLAIGASFAIGAASLGTFLVVGFIIQNITEGLAIVTPIVNDKPSVLRLALMGVLGGGPAIAGAWIGGLSYSLPASVLFLSVGAGAVFVVVYELLRMLQKDTAQNPMPLTLFSGVTAGMLVLWVTGLLIK